MDLLYFGYCLYLDIVCGPTGEWVCCIEDIVCIWIQCESTPREWIHWIYSVLTFRRCQNLVTGSVVVGPRPTLSIKGVYLLLGKYLAAGKVVADSKVASKLITLVSNEKLEVRGYSWYLSLLCCDSSCG